MLPILSYTNGPVFIAFLRDAYMREAAMGHSFTSNSNGAFVKANRSAHPESMRFSITSGGPVGGRELVHLPDVADMRKWNGLLVSD
jgi:hypothetical protein